MLKKPVDKKVIFSWIFVMSLVAVFTLFAMRYGAYVVVPSSELNAKDIEFDSNMFKLIEDTVYPPVNLGVSSEMNETECYPPNAGNVVSSHLIDSLDRDIFVYVFDMGNTKVARTVWTNIWNRESNIITKSKSKITRPGYCYGRVERLGGYYELIAWQKDKWVIMVRLDGFTLAKEEEKDFMNSLFASDHVSN